MATSVTPRIGLHRWTEDTDPWDRADFDGDNAQLEALAAIAVQGTRTGRPNAGVGRRFYYANDTAQLYYDNGAAWVEVALASSGNLDATRVAGTGWTIDATAWYRIGSQINLEVYATMAAGATPFVANANHNITPEVNLLGPGSLPTTMRPTRTKRGTWYKNGSNVGGGTISTGGAVIISGFGAGVGCSPGDSITYLSTYIAN